MNLMTKQIKTWKKVNAIYQIYPRSFHDSNGDGIGDLRGILAKLPYLKGEVGSLGVDAIWLSPIFPSPMADFGYDVSDYCDIDPAYGTLEDLKELLTAAHGRGIKVMLDFVPNHSSDQHPWFKISRSSLDNDKRSYYVWRNPKPDGSPPNNWLSIFGGSAWEWDEATGQYYLHTFLKEQPDWNWDNPDVRREMQEVLHFWFGLGVDGIRADAVRWISKDEHYRDDPKNHDYKKDEGDLAGGVAGDEYGSLIHVMSRFGPHLFTYLREMTDVVQQYPDRIMIFEDYPDSAYSTRDQYMGFYGINPAVSMPFNFGGIGLPFEAENYRRFITEFQGFLNQDEHTPVYCFGNHDQRRMASRLGSRQARVIAVMQLGLPGLPVVYYGDELGMLDGVIKPEEERDPLNRIKPGLGQGRDPERTPMQWDSSLFAGFSTARPWLPVADSSRTHNVMKELADEDSYLSLYRQLLRLRDAHAVFSMGDYESASDTHPDVYAFGRRYKEQHVFVVLNFSKRRRIFRLPHGGNILVSTKPSDPPAIDNHGVLKLRGYEAAIVECAHHPLTRKFDDPEIAR